MVRNAFATLPGLTAMAAALKTAPARSAATITAPSVKSPVRNPPKPPRKPKRSTERTYFASTTTTDSAAAPRTHGLF
jgi:hypothetical protein